MRKSLERVTAGFLAVIMVLMMAAGVGMFPAKSAKAAELSSYLNMEFGIKYTGTTAAKANDGMTAWNIEYFNVANSAFEEGDVFYVSTKISGASNFKQVAMQSSVNNWNWNAAPKKWSDNGTADGTVVAGKMVADRDGDNLSFKIQLDNLVNADDASAEQDITLTDLYIMKVSKGSEEAVALSEDKLVDLGKKYNGTVTANANDGVYEAQYFNVNDSAYSKGDTYIISYTLGGATQFKQAVTQSSLNNWGWDDAVKVWAGNGLAQAQDVTGAMTATSAGDGVAFKIRLDSLVDTSAAPGDSIELTLTDLVVVKVANNESATLPATKQINKDRKYTGDVEAVKDGANWNVQYFNVNNSKFQEDDLVEISFKISGAEEFKQLAVQSNLNGWAWDSAPKIWKNDGVADGTAFSAVIKATQAGNGIAFKLWLDNPKTEGFEESPVAIQLTDLQVRDIEAVESLNAAYKDYFTVGAAVRANKMNNAEYRYRVAEVFGTITPENEMKPDALLNQKASQEACAEGGDGMPVLNLQYSGMTAILDFAKENNLEVRGHALVYAAQTPDWFFKVGYADDGENVTPAVMRTRMESYIKQVIEFVQTNYPGVVTSWDVVNEALDNDGNYVENNWSTTVGPSYVRRAFDYAKKYVAEGVKLYYNDYNMENQGKKDMIKGLKDAGMPLDGVGMQEHITLTYPTVSSIGSAIDYYADQSLDVQITELDVQIDEDQTLAAQADRYEALFTLFKEKSSKLSNVTLWGVNDGDSWKSQKRPLLFYDNLTPKPAYFAVLDVAKGTQE